MDAQPTSGGSAGGSDGSAQVVRVLIDAQGTFAGIVAEASSETVMIDFPLAHAPELRINQNVNLAFGAGHNRATLNVPGQVVYMGDDEDRCRLRFDIGPEASIALGTLIELRGEFRSAAKPPVPVTLRGDRTPHDVQGLIVDVSYAGLSVVINGNDAALLNSPAQLQLATLLHGNQPIHLTGEARSRQALWNEVRLGIALDKRRTVEEMAHIEAFQRFVRQCQAQFLDELGQQQKAAG